MGSAGWPESKEEEPRHPAVHAAPSAAMALSIILIGRIAIETSTLFAGYNDDRH